MTRHTSTCQNRGVEETETNEIRARFAPSPTGHLHVGVARTAILNWLFVRHHKGKFILRVEDTDQARSSRESEMKIIEDLRQLGTDWDEGPDIGGQFGPYRQTERLDMYREVAETLLKKGAAYRCFLSQEEVDSRREQALASGESTILRSPYRDALEEVWQEKLAAGEVPTIRLKVPDYLEEVVFNDLIKGEIRFKAETIPEFVMLRANQTPSYNFAVSVDDALMKISHVIRGDDHLTNTPKQILVYRAMGVESPLFAHIPMILGADRSKLSKRHGSVSVGQFMEEGYLPQALVNFLSLLSWSSESKEEILSMDRLIDEIDLDRISSSAAIFDRSKLGWMNGQYIRGMDEEDFIRSALPFLKKAGRPADDSEITRKILLSIQSKIETLQQIDHHVSVFYDDDTTPDSDADAIAQTEESQRIYRAFVEEAGKVDLLDLKGFRSVMKNVQKKSGVKGKHLWMPIRVGLTGKTQGPDLPIIIETLGKEHCIKRVRRFIQQEIS
ncbi:MAG: glutamate--tRNA ligase [Candidatus Cloacimonetes bacterium 4572_55]|nr:MAG: glutamate--tRNA ligase [Candidatus Cloacimonetes bacterium 4572_55]